MRRRLGARRAVLRIMVRTQICSFSGSCYDSPRNEWYHLKRWVEMRGRGEDKSLCTAYPAFRTPESGNLGTRPDPPTRARSDVQATAFSNLDCLPVIKLSACASLRLSTSYYILLLSYNSCKCTGLPIPPIRRATSTSNLRAPDLRRAVPCRRRVSMVGTGVGVSFRNSDDECVDGLLTIRRRSGPVSG